MLYDSTYVKQAYSQRQIRAYQGLGGGEGACHRDGPQLPLFTIHVSPWRALPHVGATTFTRHGRKMSPCKTMVGVIMLWPSLHLEAQAPVSGHKVFIRAPLPIMQPELFLNIFIKKWAVKRAKWKVLRILEKNMKNKWLIQKIYIKTI